MEKPIAEEIPVQKQRQRIEAAPTRATTPTPSLSLSRTRSNPVQQNEKPRTLDQSFSGVIDPSKLTVFGDNSISPVRSQPRLISQDVPKQFQIPAVSKIRKLPDPKVVPEQDVKIVSDKESDQEFVEIPKIISESEFTVQQAAVPQTPPRVQQPLAQPRPFVAFQANDQPPRQQPVIPQQQSTFQSFPAQPSSPQQPSVVRNPPQSSFQSFPAKPATSDRTQFKPQQAVPQKPSAPFVQLNPSRAQPEIRQPQPIPFQTIPAVQPRQQPQSVQPAPPLQQRQPAPVRAPSFQSSQPTQQQTSNDIFEGRPSLFSQPIEIPATQGGASFSYEAVLG